MKKCVIIQKKIAVLCAAIFVFLGMWIMLSVHCRAAETNNDETQTKQQKIIRIGSAGALQDDVNVMDVVIAMSACTDSNYGSQYQLPGTFAPTASYNLVARAVEVAKEQGTPVHVGTVVSSDVFYSDNPETSKAWRKMGVLCAEMECAALFMNAARAGKEALGILTISDHMFREEAISAEARQTSFNKMMEIALGI